MRPELEKIVTRSSKSFIARVVSRDRRPLLTQAWHYHPEIEICYTLKSDGIRYVGNRIMEYTAGDVVLLGSNLPHGFTTTDHSEQYVIQFSVDFLGKHFFSLSEFTAIRELLELSQRGLLLQGEEQKIARQYIEQLFEIERSNTEQLLLLLQLLHFLTTCKSLQALCSEKYSSAISESKLSNVQIILDFIKNNFHKEININKACEAINLSESAFYKFVKRHTNKKFTTLVNEYRIEHASMLLASEDRPISEIAYSSGYNNFSYFNRVFKKAYGMSPREYRNQYRA